MVGVDSNSTLSIFGHLGYMIDGRKRQWWRTCLKTVWKIEESTSVIRDEQRWKERKKERKSVRKAHRKNGKQKEKKSKLKESKKKERRIEKKETKRKKKSKWREREK